MSPLQPLGKRSQESCSQKSRSFIKYEPCVQEAIFYDEVLEVDDSLRFGLDQEETKEEVTTCLTYRTFPSYLIQLTILAQGRSVPCLSQGTFHPLGLRTYLQGKVPVFNVGAYSHESTSSIGQFKNSLENTSYKQGREVFFFCPSRSCKHIVFVVVMNALSEFADSIKGVFYREHQLLKNRNIISRSYIIFRTRKSHHSLVGLH